MPDDNNGADGEQSAAKGSPLAPKPRKRRPVKPPQADLAAPVADVKADAPDIKPQVSQEPSTISEDALVDRINRSDLWMIRLTAAIVFVGAITAYIAHGQLVAMQGQLDEMKSSSAQTDSAIKLSQTTAQAALAANEIATSSLIAAQRAYVRHGQFIEGGWFRISLVKTDKGYGVNFAPVWTNVGNTPTRGTRIWVSPLKPLGGGNSTDIAAYDFTDDKAQANFSAIELGPRGGSIDGAVQTITPDQIAAIRAKKLFYVYGWAKYRNMFPDTPERQTRFCGIVDVELTKDPKGGLPIPNLYSTVCPVKYECTDDECDR